MQYINSNALAIGTILDKKYKILKILGEGGFGITYKAMDISLDRLCVIKEFLPSNFAVRSNDNTTVSIRSQADIDNYKWGLKSFIQEAKTLAKFQHPNIVHIITFFEANNTAYFEMPYEEGIDLEEYVKEIDSDFSEQQILDIAIPILNGLNEAHKRNILHRDIKPGNILLRENGMPMLIDFGAAREALGSKSHDLTQVLTPKYAPTEQYLSDRTKQGAFTDIYALGITLYLLITNQSASDIPAAPDRQDAVYINNQPDPLKKPEAGKYSQNLIDTIMKMIEIRSKDRPQDCDSVIEMLVTGICSSTKKETFTPDTELSDLDEVAIKESVEDEKQPLLQKKEIKAKKKNFLFFIIIAIVVVSLVAAGVIIYQGKESNKQKEEKVVKLQKILQIEQEAEKARQLALKKKQEAEKARKAEKAKQLALKKKQEAEKAKQLALKKKQEAEKAKQLALKKKQEAEKARKAKLEKQRIAKKKKIALERKTEIFYDKSTGLTWQDNKAAATVQKNWSGAKEYCKNLTLGGYSDWRLADYNELLSIVDYTKYNPAIKSGFKHVASGYYWSSSESVSDSSRAWRVSFYDGYTYNDDKSGKDYVRCVRGRQ